MNGEMVKYLCDHILYFKVYRRVGEIEMKEIVDHNRRGREDRNQTQGYEFSK